MIAELFYTKTDYTQMHFGMLFIYFLGILAAGPVLLFYWEKFLKAN